MYKVTCISNGMEKIQVVEDGKYRAVDLLPGDFTFTDTLTDQLNQLKTLRRLRIREVAKRNPPVATTTAAAQAGQTGSDVTLKAPGNGKKK